jgi:hypothetical protein
VKRHSSFVKRRVKTLTKYASRDAFHVQDSGINGFRPHSQRRDREGVDPLPLLESSYAEHNKSGAEKLSRSRRLRLHLTMYHEKNQTLVSIHPAMVLSHRSSEFHFSEKEYDRGIYV